MCFLFLHFNVQNALKTYNLMTQMQGVSDFLYRTVAFFTGNPLDNYRIEWRKASPVVVSIQWEEVSGG